MTSEILTRSKSSIPARREPAYDLLKAIAITLVVVYHLQPLRLAATPSNSHFGAVVQHYFPLILHLFNNQVALLAVPCFLIVSLSLLGEKAPSRSTYIYRRLIHLLN